MSVLRGVTVLLAALFLAAGAGAARAQTPIITARAGDAFGRTSQYVDVPITVDMRGAPGLHLGSYRAELRFDPRVLLPVDGLPGDFALPTANLDSASVGRIRFTAIQPSGADGLITLVVLRFVVVTDTLAATITLSFDEMSAAGTFTDLLPYLTVRSGTFCRALGTWGDADLDGRANSRDALVALSEVVGLLRGRDTTALDTVYVDSITTRYDTIATVRPSLADVDADGAVTSRDALIIMTYAVGLPVDAFRIGQPAAGACSATGTVTLTVTPDTLELQSGQSALIVVVARDSLGRPLPATRAVWRSSNSAVAAYNESYWMPAILGRSPGVATLTAELSPGVRASVTVSVVERRLHWYVDAVRATNVVTQTGSPRHPMAFIGNALDYGQDGDTIHVAPGNYEEVVDRLVSVAIVGDSANRPVIDARSYPYYNPWSTKAVRLGSRPGLVTLRNLRIVGGGVVVGSHDLVVRNVRIDAPGAQDAFMFESQATLPPGVAPGGAPQPAPSVVPGDFGHAHIDGLYVAGYQETGIVVTYADSVIIRNSTAVRDSLGTAYCYYPTSLQYAGIAAVYIGTSTELRDNTVAKAPCSAIRVVQPSGRAVVSRNRVLGARAGGIVVAADTVELDHNLVRDVQSYSGYPAVGIEVTTEARVRRVVSLGDSVINVAQQGFTVDSTLVGVVDSLLVDSTAQDHVGSQPGVALRGGRFTLRNSHISNTWGENAVSVCGWNATLTSRGNHITNPGFNGISAYDCTGYSDGPDSLISVSDTVTGPFSTGPSRPTGIRAAHAVFASVDSAVVSGSTSDSAMGVGFSYVRRGMLRDAKIHDLYRDGAYAAYSDTVLFERDSITNTGWGFWVNDMTDTVRVRRSVIRNTRSTGIGTRYGTVLRMDTSVVTGTGVNSSALSFDYGSGARITGSRLEGSRRYGVHVYSTNGSTSSVVLRYSSLASNDSGGVRSRVTPVDAKYNWWGRLEGPVRDTVARDTNSVVGDSVVFDSALAALPSFPTLVPPPRGLVASGAGWEERAGTVRGATHDRADRGERGDVQPGGTRAPSLPAPTADPGAQARLREHVARPAAPWRRGEAPNQTAPRNN